MEDRRERDENTGLKQGQHADSVCSSCLHKEEQERRCLADQVQGQMPEEPLHPCPQGHRQGRQAEAVAPTGYVKIFLQEQERERGRTIILILRFAPGLTIIETPKKNAKGKRVAQSS